MPNDLFKDYPELLNARVTFGLQPDDRQKVANLLAEGKEWKEIGKIIGWEPNTLRQYYERSPS